ncbi:MAG: hypothetical protein HC913_06530 [Microscillaceae bacterium]|nr:hypothetical protein [Microscillaceae bacterium]
MKTIRYALLAVIFFTCFSLGHQAFAQGSGIYGSGLKVNLDSTGKKYVRFIIWNQLWTRYINNNPGTIVMVNR